MSLKEKLFDSRVSRRSFLKGMAAVGTTAALYGCGSGGDGAKSYIESETVPTPPEITGAVVPGAAPHNCGGRCVTKVYVENDTIKRIVTDETPDENLVDSNGMVDKPQMRACVRCRANRQRFYRSDRILKPLKQTRERGNVGGFVEISWDQAATEIAEKLEFIANKYGPESLYNHYVSGDGSEVPNAGSCAGRLLNLLGGQMQYRSDYSWPSLEHTSWFYFGQNFYFPPGKSRQDAFNADVVVVWSGNFAESIWGTNTGWYLEQLKEMGKEVIIVDSRYSQTVATHATRYISPLPGTDAAVIAGMIYHLIDKTWDKDGNKIGDALDPEFILKYTHGFFDDKAYDEYPNIPKGYHDDVDRENKYIVPDGASLSAFIMGKDDDRLVKAGLNGKTSIYPGEIGYNNYNPEDPNDPLKDAYVPIYGQEPKTPEWAEKISGVPADTIKELAEIFAKKKVTMWLGGGFQRQSEGEQGPLFCYTIASITKNFGEPGRHVGVHGDRQLISFGIAFPAGDNEAMGKFFSDYPVYDFTKISSPGDIDYTAGELPKYYPAITMFTFPVFLWPDVVNSNGEGKSMWNDGQVKNLPPVKALLNFGGNCLVNQCGDYNRVSEIVKDKNKVELIVVSDQFMTPTAKFADYILPAATAFEKEGACTGWLAGDALIRMNKAVEPLGEALPDYDIVTMIADKLGLKDKFTEGKTAEDWIRDVVEPLLQAYGAKNEDGTPMSYEDWKEKGLFHMDETYGTSDPLEGFRADPEENPLQTPTGKLEIYCQAMVEDYEARGYNNIDRQGKKLINGTLKIGPGEPSDAARYVYPIPMYIPMLEGAHKHAVTGKVIDPLGNYEKGYKFVLGGWHIMYRSHSTHNNNAYLNELFKKNINGEKAFLDYQERDYTAGPWDDNVYEPIWINPNDARDLGISTGDRVIVESPRGSIYASAVVTQRIRPGMLGMGQGGWANGDNKLNQPDVGGAINVLTKLRPSRICQGMTLGQDTLVKIRKA